MRAAGLICVFLGALVLAPPARALPLKPASFTGEKASYTITYFGVTAGSLELSADSSEAQAHFVAKARTDSFFSLIYRLRNRYQTDVDTKTGLPARFSATLDESRQSGRQVQEFNQTEHTARLIDQRDLVLKPDIAKDFTTKLPPATQDVLSSIYHLRLLPLALGKTFEFPVLIGEKIFTIRAEVLRIEDLPTELGRLPAFVIQPSLVVDGAVKEIPDTQFWIANDDSRALLKIKAKVKIGSVVAYLNKFQSSL